MNVEADLARLERRARGFEWQAGLAIAVALGLLALAFAVGPGGYGATERFQNIQLPLVLQSYFDGLGVRSSLSGDRLVFGVQLEQLRMAFYGLRLIAGIAMLGCVLRLKWRPALGVLAAIVVASSIDGAFIARDGYRVADMHEFGAWLKPLTTRANGDAPTVDSQLTTVGGSPAEIQGRNAASRRDVDGEFMREYDRRKGQAARFKSDVASGVMGMNPAQTAAMHYAAAEVGYVVRDAGEVARQLNAIPQAQFPTTFDSDWRIRVMQEFVAAQNLPLAGGAYRPVTGWPFPLLRAASWLLAGAAFGVLAAALVLTEWARAIRRRLKRMLGLEAKLRPEARTAGVARAPA